MTSPSEIWTAMDGPDGPIYYADIADIRLNPVDPVGRLLNLGSLEQGRCEGELVEWRGTVEIDGQTVVLVIVNR